MASPNPTLPPDQSLRIYTKDQCLIILSVTENGLHIGKGTDYEEFEHADCTNGVYLFTESLAVTSNVKAPCGLTAATWTLIGPSQDVELDASGVQGNLGTGEHPEGGPGGRGGTVGLYVQDLDDAAAKTFTLLAHGGGGSDSTTKIGDGGNGGVITSVLQPTYLRVLKSVQEYLTRSEFHQDQGSVVTAATDPLYHAAEDLLIVGLGLSASDDTITRIFGRLRAELDMIKDNKGSTMCQLRAATNFAAYTLANLIKDQWNSVAPSPDDVRGGYSGCGIGVKVGEGKGGTNGQIHPTFLGVPSQIANLVDAKLPFAHPEQCAMLLERANILFYMGSRSLRNHASRLYQRLVERLSFVPELKSSDQLYKAYQESQIMPSTCLTDLDRIRRSASAQLVQLNSGKTDYYGHSPRWAPRASYTFYKSFLDDALRDFVSFEDAYIQYTAALKKQDDLNDKIKLAYANTSQMVFSLDKDMKDLWKGLDDLNRKIDAMKDVVNTVQKELLKAYDAEKSKIRTAFGLSIPQITSAFTSICFAPEAPMTILQAGDLLFQGFTSVPTIDGPVKKEYLASKISQSEATISNVSLKLATKIDGTYQLDEAFSERLLLDKQQILSELNKFSTDALGGVDDADTRKALKEKFDAYIDAVTKRNGFIFQYNVKVNLLRQKHDEVTEFEKKQKELETKQVAHNDPDLTAITAYVNAIYQSSRLRVMKLLDTLSRALNFRMLTSHSVVAFAFGTDDPKPDNIPLSLTSAVLAMARGNIEDQFSKEFEILGSDPIHFPSKFDNEQGKYIRGKCYSLRRAYREHLIGSRSVVLSIPPVLRDTEPSQAGDFGGCCNVRIHRARFGFEGLKTKSGVRDGEGVRVQVRLTHGGDETIISRSNDPVDFEHDPISTTFSFHLHNDGSMTVEDDGTIVSADANNTATSYAPPGPFAEWTVDLSHTEFDKLDFSKVTEAYFDFCGTNYAYN